MNITQFSAQNRRPYQEDRSFIKKFMNGDILLGVFDGHGGELVAEYAATHTSSLFRAIDIETKKDPQETLSQLYALLVQNTSEYYSGSTANIVWIKDNVAHVAVLGDSITLIQTATGEIWQSPEHNISTNEAEAIEAIERGGYIDGVYLFDKKVYQGMGLQMSRALGDRELNRILNREPEIFHIQLNKDSWILLCSDGLIDPSHKTTNNCDSVVEFIENGADAEKLVLEMAKKQNKDNSTAILARMD
jgi:serine/threonine protein phosphatase PrpC